MTNGQILCELDRRAWRFSSVEDPNPWWMVGNMVITLMDAKFLAASSPQYVTRGEAIELAPDDILELLAFDAASKAIGLATARHWNEVILTRVKKRLSDPHAM